MKTVSSVSEEERQKSSYPLINNLFIVKNEEDEVFGLCSFCSVRMEYM